MYACVVGFPPRPLHFTSRFDLIPKFGGPKGNEIPIEVVNTVITVSSVPPCDVNANGTVDIFDLILVAQVFGQESKTRADTNGDGVVDIFDLIVVAQCFGQGAAPAIVKQPDDSGKSREGKALLVGERHQADEVRV